MRRIGRTDSRHDRFDQQERDMRDTCLSRFLHVHVLKKRDMRDTCLSHCGDTPHQKARQACRFPVALFAPIVALFPKTVALMDLSMSRFLATIKQTSYVALSK